MSKNSSKLHKDTQCESSVVDMLAYILHSKYLNKYFGHILHWERMRSKSGLLILDFKMREKDQVRREILLHLLFGMKFTVHFFKHKNLLFFCDDIHSKFLNTMHLYWHYF